MAELRDCPTCGDFFNYTGITGSLREVRDERRKNV